MVYAGLRVSEATSLRWRAVDLNAGRIRVESSKTDAGRRSVSDLPPELIVDLKRHRERASSIDPNALVFPTSTGRERTRSTISRQILTPAVDRANKARAEAELPPIRAGVTNHSLRRTFASLLYGAGASPAYVMAQMGHKSAALALEVYAKSITQAGTGAGMTRLVRGADWAQMGTNEGDTADEVQEAQVLPFVERAS